MANLSNYQKRAEWATPAEIQAAMDSDLAADRYDAEQWAAECDPRNDGGSEYWYERRADEWAQDRDALEPYWAH